MLTRPACGSTHATKTLRLPTVCRVPDDAPPARPAISSVRAHGRPGHDLPQPEEGFPWLPLLGPPEAPPRDGLPAPDEHLLQSSFTILVPDYCPEHCQLLLRVPCSVDHVLGELAPARHPICRRRFPYVFPVCPQPSRAYGTLLAVPDWMQGGAAGLVILMDCRASGGAIFAAVVGASPSREELLYCAGAPDNRTLFVVVATEQGLLAPGECARLFQGALVIVSAYPEVTVPDCMLSDMLRTTAHWQALPPSPHFRVPSVWVLTDAEPFRLEFAPGQSDIRSSQVAAMAGYDPHSIALCVAAPPLSDHSRWGWHTLTVAVASQHFERRRHPQEGPFVVFIDQRPAMLGVGWRLFPGPLFPLQAFVDDYANTCPAHLSVAVSGSETVDMPEGTCLRIRDGLTLIVEYVYIWHPDPGDEDVSVASSAPTSFPGGDTDTDSSNPSEDGDAEPGPDPLSEGSTPATGGSFCGAHHQVSLLTAVVCFHLVQPACAVDLGVGHRPISVGDRLFSVPREPHQPLVVRLGLLSAFSALYTTQYKLLCEPACSSLAGNQRLQAARTGTLRLGLAWPFQPAGPHPLEVEEETGSSSETDSVGVLIDISCLILVPDHEPERVTFEVQIPAAPAHAIATANHCRSGPNCDLFPGLQPVWPQPDARWAVLLALPEWEHAGPLICLDLYAVDGRIFAFAFITKMSPCHYHRAAGFQFGMECAFHSCPLVFDRRPSSPSLAC